MTYVIQDNPNHSFGVQKEKEAQQIICQANNVSVVLEQGSDNYWKEHYDFMTSDGLKYEVKANRKSVDYGTFFIETAQSIKRGKEFGAYKNSGLTIAKADYWMLWHGNVYLKIEQAALKMLIHKNQKVYKRLEDCQPNPTNRTKGVLVDAEDVEKISEIYDIEKYINKKTI